nr:hypothetical protein [uncultured Pseudomonas sp.]
MKILMMVLAIALSSVAMAEDGFDQTPLAQALLSDESADGSNQRFAQMLERQPTAAGKQQEHDEKRPEEYRSPERPSWQDD